MYLKAVLIEEAKDASNGNKYKVVTFQELSRYAQLPMGLIEIKTNARPAKRTIWEGQDGLFNDFKLNEVTGGCIKKFDVEPYQITDVNSTSRTVTTFTGVQFEGETDDVTVKRYGHKPATVAMPTPETEINKQVAAEFSVPA